MPTSPSSLRLDSETEGRVKDLARMSGCSQSEWKRRAISAALDQADLAATQAAGLTNMANQLTRLEESSSETHRTADRTLDAICDLAKTLAIERAADRAFARQVYRMALRAAYLGVQGLIARVPLEQREDAFKALRDEADAVYEDEGLPRIEEDMKVAREEVRLSTERRGTL